MKNKNEQMLVTAAKTYAQEGWKVFPCQHFGKKQKTPYTPNGFHDASDDPEQIEKWWNEFPKAWIGVRTGRESGFFVIDVDMKNGKDGVQSLKNHFGGRLDLSTSIRQKTITGGFHLLYKWSEKHPVANSQDVLSGIDVRGEGGYIIAYPSGMMVEDEWMTYHWDERHEVLEPVLPPEWVLELVSMPGQQGTTRNGQIDLEQAFNGLPEGQRDSDIYELAKLCRWQGISKETTRVIVSTVAERCKPAFDMMTAMEKVDRVFDRYDSKTEKNDFVARMKKITGEGK